jgi:predicted NACHT family NTPase
LTSWDIIDLASLPNDQDIATQRLLLRQLYMPLRIGFEAEMSDQNDQDSLVNLEQNREASRLRDAGRSEALEWHAISTISEQVAIGERLGAGQRFVVLGDPGGGKTTMLRWLATAYLLRHTSDPAFDQLPDAQTLPAENWIPVLIRCRDIGEEDLCRSFKDVLEMHLNKTELQPKEAQVMSAVILDRLARGEILLLVDGLDEISNLRVRQSFCQQLERTAVRYPNAPILVTSRIVGYRDMPDRMRTGFAHAVIGDLLPETKDLFANRWVEATEAHQTTSRRPEKPTEAVPLPPPRRAAAYGGGGTRSAGSTARGLSKNPCSTQKRFPGISASTGGAFWSVDALWCAVATESFAGKGHLGVSTPHLPGVPRCSGVKTWATTRAAIPANPWPCR